MLFNPLVEVAQVVADGSTDADERRPGSVITEGAMHAGLCEERTAYTKIHTGVTLGNKRAFSMGSVAAQGIGGSLLVLTQGVAGMGVALATPIGMRCDNPGEFVTVV